MAIDRTPDDHLTALAQAANAEHAACAAALRTTLNHAIRAGELLREARALVPHGGWLPWLEANFAGSERTAQNYMRLAARQAELPDAQIRSAADLSLNAALETLATPRALPAPEPADEDEDDTLYMWLCYRLMWQTFGVPAQLLGQPLPDWNTAWVALFGEPEPVAAS
jgi:hypothetical protein